MNLLAVLVWLLAVVTSGEPVEKEIAAAFPGWTVVDRASGDLDGDQVADLAVTVQRPAPEQSESGNYEGALAVFLRGADGALRLQTRAPKAVCFGCGGVKGIAVRALGAPSINAKGILIVTYTGGSRQMWDLTYKWRYEAKTDRFLLVGETHHIVDTHSDDGELDAGQVSSEDINYLSGKMLRTISKGGTQSCKVKRRAGRAELRTFDIEAEQGDDHDRSVKGSCRRT